ncbi:MAG TPA: DNA mismatch endonuclease Vsr [Candidatus Paceibacterota bacterium]
MIKKIKLRRLDPLSPKERSERMGRVHAKDTKAEMAVRRLLHSMGYRYRLHDRTLPGYPDIVFRKRKKMIFVHGCFWHRHHCRSGKRLPKTRLDFWLPKLNANKKRDQKNLNKINRLGWLYLIIWECETRNILYIKKKIINFLES